MSQNNFIVDLLAKLQEARSRKQIQADAKKFADIKVPLTGTLDKTRTKEQIERDVKTLKVTNTVNIKGKVDNKSVTTTSSQALQQAQNIANKRPIRYNAEIRKDKLINDIKILGQQNSKLFKDAQMSAKYNTLLDNAKLAITGKEVKNLRAQLSALRSEIKANNLAGVTLGETFKRTFKRATQLFTGTGMVMLATKQLRQAWTEAMNLDKAYTDLIKVQNELTRGNYPEYLDKCNKKAQELATTQKALIESTTEFSKSGYDLKTSDALTKYATILSNVGDMSAMDSSKAIISGVQAYDSVDGFTDVVNKAQALIDKYNEIGNTASITTAEIAQGVQEVGTVFADANTSVDEFIALLSAGNRAYQDADAMALSLRTAALRIRGCKTELELLGEETDSVYTSSSKLQEKIAGLTNIDGSGGVKILEDDGETFRSIYDIFVDISKVYNKISDTDQSALLELISGKHRASAISSVLTNMSEAQEIYERSLSSAGSAQEEYNKYLKSSEASLNTFKASLTEAYQLVLDGSTTKAILDSGTAVLNFANSMGLIEKGLKGLLLIGVAKGITKLSMAFKASAIQANNFGIALKTANSLSTLTNDTTKYANAMNVLSASTVGLSEAQLKQVLSSKALSDSQRIEIMRLGGLSRAQAKAKLMQMGLIQGTKTQATAQNVATTSTFRLTSAVKGFGASLKSFIVTNKFTLAIMAITTVVSSVKSAMDSASEKADEFVQKQDEIISKQDEIISSTENRIDALQSLKEKLEETNGSQAKMLALTDQINDVLGDGKSKILENADAYTLLNAQIEREIELEKERQNQANKEKRDAAFNKAKKTTTTDTKYINEEVSFKDIYNTDGVNYGIKSGGNTEYYKNTSDAINAYIEHFNPTNVDDFVDAYYSILTSGNLKYKFTKKELKDSFNTSLESLYTAFEDIINNGDGFLGAGDKQGIIEAMFVQSAGVIDDEWRKKVEEAISFIDGSSENVTLAFDKYRDALRDNIEGNEDIAYENIVAIINGIKEKYPEMSSVLDSWLADMVNSLQVNVNKAVTEASILPDISTTIDNLDKKVKPVMDSLKSAYQDIFTEDGFTLDNVGIDMLNSVKESIEEINEAGVNIDSSSFEEFAKILSTTEITMSGVETKEEEVHKAFNDLVGDIINGANSLNVSSEAIDVLVQSLEEMGVTNASEVVNDILSIKDNLNSLSDEAQGEVKVINDTLSGMGKEGITTTNALTDCIWEEIDALLNASDTYGFTADKIKEYTVKKIWSNQNKINTREDMAQLLIVAQSAGIATEALANYEKAKEMQKQGYGGGQAWLDSMAKAAYQSVLDEIQTLYNFELPEYKPKDSSSSSKSSKDSTSSFDWIETQISNMEDELDSLDNKVTNTYSKWEQRNKDLVDSIAKTNEAIKLQENAANAYINEANSLGVSSHYKTLVQKGALNIEDISDKDLADKISEYQDLYEKSKECTDKANELRQTLNELSSSEKWDLLKSKSDADIDILDKKIDAIQTSLDKLDLKGIFANSSYYNDMVDLTRNKISSLISQETELQNILKIMTTGTEAYDTMFAELMDIRNQIAELENDCIEFNNNIRDLDWEIFEFFEDSISRITEEIDFFKDLLSDKDMFDDNGKMTKYAETTLGLHYANIETYKKQAQDYYEEMQELQQQLVNGAGQDVLQQYREMEKLHHDMVLAIQDEQKAVLDLVQNGYEEQLKILQEINQVTLDRMDAERDLYNFQKDIEKKTQERTSIQRQMDVLRGDDSEQAKSKLQQLEVKLSDVNADIEETLYEQQRNDIQAMLDALESGYQAWYGGRLDNESALLEDIRSEIETKSDEIKTTLDEVASEYGTTLSTSLADIFGTEKPFDSVVTAINNLVDKIGGIVGNDNKTTTNQNTNVSTKQSATTVTASTEKQNTQSIVDTKSKSDADSIFISQKSSYPKNELNKDSSIVDRLKYFDFASDIQSRATYYKKLGGTGTYTGSTTQNKWLINKMKEMGYASGTNYASSGLHWTQELGDELIIRKSDGALLTPLGMGDKVVNADGTSNLFAFANDPQGFLEKFDVMNYAMPAVNLKLPDMPVLRRDNTPSVENNTTHMEVVLPNVQNYDEFMNHMIHDNRFEKVVQSMTLGRAMGGNSMNKYKY